MMNNEIFDKCSSINRHIQNGEESRARDELIRILAHYESEKIPYDNLINYLIRETGLYPYMRLESARWQERYLSESFKVDIGADSPAVLHREQSSLLRSLLDGENLAISAPTSFGKSFVIDSFIAIKRPTNVVIIVPTIALADETRRRLNRKFSSDYKIITTADIELAERNIFIFPQERAIGYVDKIEMLDILIIDEFYKASKKFDKERAPSLINAIIRLSKKAKQRYFLAPNISQLNKSIFTKGMQFRKFDFNTVFLEKNELYKNIGDEAEKSRVLLDILAKTKNKSLIYAGTYSNITNISNLILTNVSQKKSLLLNKFSEWLSIHYDPNWTLTSLVKRGTGIHNGQLHRSLSQIQVKLFEEPHGLKNIISTSSIVEGVNTSAENVIIWSNKNGKSNLNDFTYKNIIGRSGRMFKHFIGKVYILESPPKDEQTILDLDLPDELLGTMDEIKHKEDLTSEQIQKIIDYKNEMSAILGETRFADLLASNAFQSSDSHLLKKIAIDIRNDPTSWNGLGFLNSDNPADWDRLLYKIINLSPGGWEVKYSVFVEFIKILSKNWTKTIPQLLSSLDRIDVGIDTFFKLERNVVFKFSSLLSDVNLLQASILKNKSYDVSPFLAKISFAFLPPVVYQLEEYGLPRMLSRKIHSIGLINFEDSQLTVHSAIEILNSIGLQSLKNTMQNLQDFDSYILDYFFEGIRVSERAAR